MHSRWLYFSFLSLLLFPVIGFADPVYWTGFELGTGEPFQSTNGSPTIQSSIKNKGTYALQVNPVGAGTEFVGISTNSEFCNCELFPISPFAFLT